MASLGSLARVTAIAAALSTVATQAAAQQSTNVELLRAVLECRERSTSALSYATIGLRNIKPGSVVAMSPGASFQREDWLDASDAKPFGLDGAVMHHFLVKKYEDYGPSAKSTTTIVWSLQLPATFEDTAQAIAATFGTPVCDRGVIPPATMRLRPCSYKATAAHGTISMISIEGAPAEITCR